MGSVSREKKSGCGLFNLVFGPRHPRRSTSTGSLPTPNVNHVTNISSTPESKTRKDTFGDTVSETPNGKKDQKQVDRIIARPGQDNSKSPRVHQQQQQSQAPKKYHQNQVRSQPGYGQARKVPRTGFGISDELESMIQDHHRLTGAGGSLVRASSSNFMLSGSLGNLKQPGKSGGSSNVLDSVPKTAKEEPSPVSGKYSTSVMGNVVKRNNELEKPVSLSRALSTRMDPEQLNILGNEDYKNGRFAEAVALYDAAISENPNKASYRSNKSAALAALGKFLEAAFECREAIRIDPFYQRAHNRLATICVRLGEAEKASYHFKQSGSEADPDAMSRGKQIQLHLNKCTEAKRRRDWNTLVKETDLSIAAGADSAPLIFGLRAEALLKMNRHREAVETVENGPNFLIDDCTRFFGPIGSARLLVYRSQIDMVAGRFDDAVAAAERATKLDPNNKEASLVFRRTRAVATARRNGNELFKLARYSEACIAYAEGLDHDPYNAVLLCNRAACRSKLGHYEKAIEDCDKALNVRASYSKARLRRADCYVKMGKWGACIQDFEVLIKENPGDEEVGKILQQAKAQIERQGGIQETSAGSSHATGMAAVSSTERFRDYITSRGTSVVLFCNKPGDRKTMHLIEKLNHRYPSVNFLKVEVEDHPSLQKSEGVTSLPAFIIYANGLRAKEVLGDNFVSLESSIKYYISS